MNILDQLAQTPLLDLTQEQQDAIDEALYAETGIGFGHENFDDFELTIYNADGVSTDYMRWPIPGLQVLGQAVQLARMLKAASLNPEPVSEADVERAAAEATREAAECARLREAIQEKARNYWELWHQELAAGRLQQTTSQKAAADAIAPTSPDDLQTDHPPMQALPQHRQDVPHNESAAIRDLQTLLTLVPPSALHAHPRLKAMQRAVEQRGSAALEGILSLRIARPASSQMPPAAAPHAPAPHGEPPPAPAQPEPAHNTAAHQEPGRAAPEPAPPSAAHLQDPSSSSPEPTQPPAAAN